MNPQDPLANLHPLREPLAVSWWPPAPGWWLLLALGIGCGVALTLFLVRRYRRNRYRRQALQRLAQVRKNYLSDGDAAQFATQTNALLKAVALRAYPRREVAGSSGQQWLAFLRRQGAAAAPFPEQFALGLYRGDFPDTEVTALHAAAQHWIRRHEVDRD